MLASFLCGEFLLHIPCWLHFYVGSFSYTSRAGFIFMWGVSLTHPVLASFLCGEFLLHIPCWLHFYVGSFSYTSRAGFIFMWGVSLTHPVLASFLCGEFLLHIPCCLDSYEGASLQHPVLVSFFLFSFFLSFFFFYLGSFSYTSLAGFIFIWGVCLTHLVLALFLSGEFLLNIPCWIYIYVGCFSYTSMLASFFFNLGSYYYTSRDAFLFPFSSFFFSLFLFFLSFFFFLFLSGEFLLHIPCWLHFYLGSFSYTSRAGFIFIWGVSLTQPELAFIGSADTSVSFLCGKFLLHIPC